ncbi:peptidoglycan DD-metalloendopeptidase family protein [Tateyamaria omphalii]|uniref:LysM peptidoglycan-binding domain-containing M23 family metallopeptidase n=1 Tax=Tateyamaria omphalii TaxID=299262 RepID=UPI001C99CBF6|nr:LysM peptidoglycan-binding domain-containing M23 family metallopeptidase [Tateyamaria omphalii]MBY5932274.1 peptidoglycan DD-metalloendopeptidase family protein [Tateyamaria omphalii]
MIPTKQRRRAPLMMATCGLLVLAACDEPLDFDLRGLGGGFSTAPAVQNATADRPQPDDRGVISYPNYQVAVAERGDTLSDVATRVGLPPDELARFNGVGPDVPLRAGEVIALPRRVSEPSPATGAVGTGPIQPGAVDVTTLAGNAIDNAAPTPVAQTPGSIPQPQTGEEPVRHRVERGETAFTIARLYQVPVKSLAEWNGLSADFAVREGQFLLIPVARAPAPSRADDSATTAPGTGSPTPLPPSSAQPLPDDDTAAPTEEPTTPQEPVADVGQTSAPASATAMALPLQGSIIRDYAKGRNEGIDIQAAPGSTVSAAADGTVAAITESAEGVPIIVVRHPDNLLTVYANVADVSVAKGDSVSRGQSIAKLRDTADTAYLHFEVRDGFDSVNPNRFFE